MKQNPELDMHNNVGVEEDSSKPSSLSRLARKTATYLALTAAAVGIGGKAEAGDGDLFTPRDKTSLIEPGDKSDVYTPRDSKSLIDPDTKGDLYTPRDKTSLIEPDNKDSLVTPPTEDDNNSFEPAHELKDYALFEGIAPEKLRSEIRGLNDYFRENMKGWAVKVIDKKVVVKDRYGNSHKVNRAQFEKVLDFAEKGHKKDFNLLQLLKD